MSMTGMARASASEGRARHPYCLQCYAALAPFSGASQRCDDCGFVNVKRDLELFWTKEPRFVELEAYAKIAIVFLLVGFSAVVIWAMGQRSSFGLGQGWAVGFPILLGVILWDTASAITRRSSDYRASVVWRVVCALLAPWPLLLAIDLNPWARHTESRVGVPVFAAVLLLGLALAAGALGLGALGRAVPRWREARVRRAQERALALEGSRGA
jgi:hypothetical protein